MSGAKICKRGLNENENDKLCDCPTDECKFEDVSLPTQHDDGKMWFGWSGEPAQDVNNLFPRVLKPDPSEVIARMRAARDRPKKITTEQLVLAHIHEIYAQIWRAEDMDRKAAEAAREAYSLRGIRQRMWRSFVNCFSRPKGIA